MKKISILSFLAATLFMVSCQEEETPDLGVNEQWLQFDQRDYTVTENSTEPLIVKVVYAADTNPNGVTVNFTVNSENPDAYEISPSGGAVDIPAGEFEADITITPIDNADTDGNKKINVAIDNQDIPVGIVGEGKLNHTASITITDDDCELDLKSFEGTYLAKEFGYCDGCYEVKITYDETNELLILDNLYETGGTSYIELDNTDPNNPTIIFRSLEFNAPFYPGTSVGDLYAVTHPSSVSSFRTCDNFLDLYFYGCNDTGCYIDAHIQLTKI